MDIPTVPGSLYTVATKTTCDITDTATGTPIDSVSSGSVTFTAQGSVTTLSDPAATYSKVNFKNAAAALRMLGGGSDSLPKGYLSAAFLENHSGQILKLSFLKGSGFKVKYLYPAGLSNSGHVMSKYGSLYMPHRNAGTAGFFKWPSYGEKKISEFYKQNQVYDISANWKIDKSLKINGEVIYRDLPNPSVSNIDLFALMTPENKLWNANTFVRIFSAAISADEDVVMELAPAIAPDGRTVLHDKVNGGDYADFFGGQFIVGLTRAQARKLGNVPSVGGSLTISLPENYTDDEAVVEALNTATEKGWVLTIQTYSDPAASLASTFSLRRIWARKTADPDGAYVDDTGERWLVEWCQTVLGAEPSDLGYEPFRSVDVALAEWELTPYVYPEEENLSI